MRRAAIAELAVGIASPAADAPAGGERTGVQNARGDRRHAGSETPDGHRDAALRRAAVAKLAVFVVAPAQDAAAEGERAGVVTTCGDRRHARSETRDGDRDAALRRVAVSELAVVAIPPAENAAARGERTGVRQAPVDRRDPGGKPGDRRGDAAARRRAPVAELPGIVVAPAPDTAAGGDRTGVVPASNRDDSGREARDLHRNGALHRTAVAELAIEIIAPAQSAAAGGERTGVRPAKGDRGDAGGEAETGTGTSLPNSVLPSPSWPE